MSTFPLETVSEKQLQLLCQVLWSWTLCDDCRGGHSCGTESCPTQRLRRLGRYFSHYRTLTSSYESGHGLSENAAISSHEDLFDIIRLLKMHPDLSRTDSADLVFSNRLNRRPPPVADQECALNLAVKVMTMVNCSAQYQSPSMLEYGAYQVPWRGEVAFTQFILDAFPMTDHPSLNDDESKSLPGMTAALQAKKLKKRIGLKFQPTDDLRRHLKLDRKKNLVYIYHHTAFLKEHLRLTKDEKQTLSVADSLRL